MLNLSSLNPQQRLAAETLNGPGVDPCRRRHRQDARDHVSHRAHDRTRDSTRANPRRDVHEQGRARNAGTPPRSRAQAAQNAKCSAQREESIPAPPFAPSTRSASASCAQHIEKLGYKRNFVIYDESEQLGAIKKILSHISAKGEKTDPGAVLGVLSRFKNGGENAAIFADPSVRALAEHLRKRYESALRACNAVDFDDLILLTLRLFKEHPDALEACRAKYRYVMVDEYQDTNAAQFKLVHALTREHRNLCVVGDDDQSIYGWRGAEISNLLDMEKHFPEVKVVKLEQNYRSTNTILNAANAIIKNNLRRRGKQLWSQKGDGTRNRHCTPSTTDEEEARTVVEQIEYNRVAHRVPWARQSHSLPHQPPVAPAGNRPAPGRRALSSHWRTKLLRPPRNSRFPRLPENVPESERRRQPAPHRQYARRGD